MRARRKSAEEAGIRVLDEHVANKIAAGEVIERPASVVKELVENALDAGARRVDIEIRSGGKEYIRVTDDGRGLTAEQLPLAFERHATSKIAAAEDLFGVNTLGFRGEALPSIASVATVEMRSRPPGASEGAEVQGEAGRLGPPRPVGMPTGTTVVVRRLFFNTPARYKFLRSDGAERRRVADAAARIGLAWPSVALRLVADGRELFATPGDGRLASAVAAVYGAEAARRLVPIQFEQDGLRVEGVASKPDAVHGNRDRMSIFLNRRWIRSPSLLHAIQRGYERLLPPRRFPLAVVHLRVDPKAVDVNVHPAKAEVRFQDDGAVYRVVARAVRTALRDANLVGEMVLSPDPEPIAGSKGRVRETPPETAFGRLAFPRPPTPSELPPLRRKREDAAAFDGGGPRATAASGRDPEAPAPDPQDGAVDGQARTRLREMAVIGQLQRTFILGEVDTGLWIIDQHVAHERVLYERYLARDGGADGVQRLLVPVVVTLTPDRSGLVEAHREELARLGFDLEPFGGSAYAVRGVPVGLTTGTGDEKSLTAVLEEILDACGAEGRWNAHEAAAALSCRAAVKAGERLTDEQMRRLVLQLADADNPFACPHGRPVIIEVERLDLERRFGRR